MGEAQRNGTFVPNGAIKLIDTSVSDRALSGARKQYVKYLSERLLTQAMTGVCSLPNQYVKYLSERLMTAMVTGAVPSNPGQVHDRAWKLAELHYDEMIRREADNQPPSITERLAADNIVSAAGMVA